MRKGVPYITAGIRLSSALHPGREMPARRWLHYSASREGFSLAFVFKKDIACDKKTHSSSSINRILQDHSERRGEQDRLPKLTACKRRKLPLAHGQSHYPHLYGAGSI